MRRCVCSAAGVLIAAASARAAAGFPDAIAVPGAVPLTTVHAEGAMIYACTQGDGGNVWKLRDFAAVLLRDGKNVGRHYSPGPTWQLADGSTVRAKVDVRATAPDKADVDWLKLSITDHEGQGELEAATAVQRVNTAGGALSGACDSVGQERIVPYAADYIFLKPA